MEIIMKPIGYICSPFIERGSAPRQGRLESGTTAVLELLPEYEEGIADIKEGEYSILLFHFHKSTGYQLTTLARKTNRMTGLFSTRSPNRPNGIGMTIVKFIKKEGCHLTFEGVDMLDGTPVLDIKPYSGEQIPEID